MYNNLTNNLDGVAVIFIFSVLVLMLAINQKLTGSK